MKRAAYLLATLLLWLCSDILRAEVYSIDFNKGTVSGTFIKTSIKGVSPVNFCNTGADLVTLHSNTRSCFYDSNGCGIRVGDASGTGQAPFILTLCEEIQSQYIVKIVVYASRGTQDTSASLKVYAANDVIGEVGFADMKDYDSSFPESANYVLPEINLYKKFKNLQVEARSTNYVILHRIDIYTADDNFLDGVHQPKVFVDEMDVFYNLVGQCIGQPSRGIYIKGGRKYVVK